MHREEQKIMLPGLMLFHEGDIPSACRQKFMSCVLASVCLPEFMRGGRQKCTGSGLRTKNHFNQELFKKVPVGEDGPTAWGRQGAERDSF